MTLYRVTTPDGVEHEHCKRTGWGDWGSSYRTPEGRRLTIRDYTEHLHTIEEES